MYQLRSDVQGWHSDHPIFARLVSEVFGGARVSPHRKPTVIEVGSWKGASAIHLANLTAGVRQIDTISGYEVPAPAALFCVDTWLGDSSHMVRADDPQNTIPRRHGYPQLFPQFLYNVHSAGVASRVTPITLPSTDGARYLAHHGIVADLIYIDASHEYPEVYADLCAYSNLVADGGLMFGDDFRTAPGVFHAVARFAHEQDLNLEDVTDSVGSFWILRRK